MEFAVRRDRWDLPLWGQVERDQWDLWERREPLEEQVRQVLRGILVPTDPQDLKGREVTPEIQETLDRLDRLVQQATGGSLDQLDQLDLARMPRVPRGGRESRVPAVSIRGIVTPT